MRSGGILQYSHSVQVERVSFQVDSASRIPPRADHSAVLAINSREPERRELSSHERKQARGPERHGNDPNHLHEPAAEKWVTFMWVSNEWLPPPKLLISQTFNLDSSLFFPPPLWGGGAPVPRGPGEFQTQEGGSTGSARRSDEPVRLLRAQTHWAQTRLSTRWWTTAAYLTPSGAQRRGDRRFTFTSVWPGHSVETCFCPQTVQKDFIKHLIIIYASCLCFTIKQEVIWALTASWGINFAVFVQLFYIPRSPQSYIEGKCSILIHSFHHNVFITINYTREIIFKKDTIPNYNGSHGPLEWSHWCNQVTKVYYFEIKITLMTSLHFLWPVSWRTMTKWRIYVSYKTFVTFASRSFLFLLFVFI